MAASERVLAPHCRSRPLVTGSRMIARGATLVIDIRRVNAGLGAPNHATLVSLMV